MNGSEVAERYYERIDWIADAPHERLRRDIRPLLPRDDPFYRPPSGFEHARPGTVLRSREVELALLGVIPQRVTAVQLLYRTTDTNGLPLATATTVLLPAQQSLDKPCPVLSYQCAIDAVSGRCFPSYALRKRSSAIGAVTQFEYFIIAAALAEGWAVSVPDHEGPDGRWGAPYEPGYCVLDGLRAALSSPLLGLDSAAPIGLWGYSGGGLASAWAAEMSGGYAPDLNIAGAVLGSPVGDLGHTFERLNGTYLSGLPALVVAALVHTYPNLGRVIRQHASDEGMALLESLEEMTTVRAIARMFCKNMDELIDLPLDQLLELPEVQYVFENTKLGVAAPATPVLIVQAVHDQVISVNDIDELAHTYAAGGADVTYHRDLFSEHLLLHPMSAPMALRWLTDRFEGRPTSAHMARTTWPTMFNPMTYKGMWRLGVTAAKVVAGRKITRRPR